MKPVILTSDSVCDLPEDLRRELGVKVIPLTVVEGEEPFKDGLGITPDQIYERYEKEGLLPKTTAISPQEFLDFFGPLVEEGYEVVHLDISAKLSGTYQNACIAAGELEGVYVIDTCHLSTSMGLMLLEGARLRDEGRSAREITEHLEAFKEKLVTTFVVDNLEFIWKGGRCSGVTALGANLLKIRPCLGMQEGELKVGKKYRGSMEKVYEQYIRDVLSLKNIDTRAGVLVHSGGIDPEVLARMEALVRELVSFDTLYVARAGCTVSSHCGPGTLGVLFALQ